jgi:GT2 family glycosyltransferase
MTSIGVVVIGRNEGERLRRCLESVRHHVARVVYVDSGSTDGSVAMAKDLGADVVALDMSRPFTAARARNAGVARLAEVAPALELVQLVDGDCEVCEGWLEKAVRAMAADAGLAVVCGRLRERHPEASVYNRLCDFEWDRPIGPEALCGGIALIRTRALAEVGGQDDTLIAGEEPEMCLRMRQRGWGILRIDADMALHDANMTRFEQWWRRSIRSGWAYAEVSARHGGEAERFWVRETRSNWFWGVGVPAAVLAMALPTVGLSLGLGGGSYLLLWRRIKKAMLARGLSEEDAALYARYLVLGKVPQGLGQLRYWHSRLIGRRGAIIEYRAI